MPGKVMKLIKKTLHPDGYYTATISTSETSEAATAAAEATTTPKAPHIKIWFRLDKGLIIGPEEREKLIREEQELAAAAKADIPTPGFVLVKQVEAKTTAAAVSHHHHDSSSSDYFQSKLEATKRKMHDSYEELTKAKKLRRIQVIDPHDLPPQSSSKGKCGVVAARKKMVMITTNRKTRSNNNNNFFNGGGRHPKLIKPPTSIC